MARYSRTPPDKATKTKYSRTDTSSGNDLQQQNNAAWQQIANYNKTVANGGYMSAEDVTNYNRALQTYVNTGNQIRANARKNGYVFTDEDENRWQRQIAQLSTGAADIGNVFSQYENEETWKAAGIQAEKDAKQYAEDMAYDVPAAQRRLAQVNKQLELGNPLVFGGTESNVTIPGSSFLTNVPGAAQRSTNIAPADNGLLGAMNFGSGTSTKVQQPSATTNQLEQEKKDLEERIARATEVQRFAKMEGVGDPTSENYDPEFESKSVYDPTKYQPQEFQWWNPTAYSTDEYLVYAALNGDEDAIAQLAINAQQMGKAAGGDNSTGGDPMTALFFEATEGKQELTQLSPEEIKTYNYYANTVGIDAANDYLNALMPTLLARQREEERTRIQEMAKKYPLEADVASTLMSPLKVLSATGQVADKIVNGKIDENAAYNRFSYMPGDIRATRSAVIEEKLGNALGENWGKVGSWGYQLGMSQIDNVVNMVASGSIFKLGGTAGRATKDLALFLMGSGAMADTVINYKQKGLSDDQALGLGIVAGVIEALTESVPMEHLLSIKANGKSALVQAIDQALSESGEEFTSSVVNAVADAIIAGDKSEWAEAQAEGKTAWEFVTDKLAEAGLDALGGFISGGFMGGIGSIGASHAYRTVGKTIVKGNAVNTLVDLGNQFDNKDIAALTKRVAKHATAENVGQLYYTIYQDMANFGDRAKRSLTNAFEHNGMGAKTAKRISNIIVDAWMGGEVTDEGAEVMAAIGSNSSYANIVDSVINDPNSQIRKQYDMWSKVYDIVNTSETADNTAAETTETPEQTATDKKAQRVTPVQKTAQTATEVTTAEVDAQTAQQTAEIQRQKAAAVRDAVSGAKNMTESGKAVILKGGDSAAYTQEALKVYRAGFELRKLSDVKTNNMTAQQKQAIYDEGYKAAREQRAASAKKSQEIVDALYREAKAKGAEPWKKGKSELDGINEKDLSRDQHNSFKMSARIADKVNAALRLYNGTEGEWGYYDHATDTICLNINAKWSEKTMLVYTFAHEMVHRARKGSPEMYNKFAEFLLDNYAKKGVDVETLVYEQIRISNAHDAKLPKNQRVNMDYDMGLEEVIADACQRMLVDTDAGKRLMEWAETNNVKPNIVAEIKRMLERFLKAVRDYLKGVPPESEAAKEFAKLEKSVQQTLADMFVDMSVDAGRKLSTIKAADTEAGRVFLATKNISYNLKAVESHKAKLEETYAKQAEKGKKDASVPLDQLMKRYDKMLEIWDKIGIELNSTFLEEWNSKVGTDRAFSVFKAQSGYKYNIELSTMCKKGVALFDAIDTLVRQEAMKELGTEVMGKAEKELLYDILKTEGFEIPCAICYVEQARQREGVIIDAFLNGNSNGKLGWNQVLTAIEKEMAALGVDYSFTKVSRDIATEKYTRADIKMDKATQDAFYGAIMKVANEEIQRYNKEQKKSRPLIKAATFNGIKEALANNVPANLKIFKVLTHVPSSRFRIDSDLLYSSDTTHNLAKAHQELYSLFNSQGGVSGYKTKQKPIVYWGDLLEKTWTPANVRKNAAIRNQSNSDGQVYTLLDMVQMYIDLSAKGYYLQAYTKVVSELKLLGLSGAKINASLIPKVVVYYNTDGTVDFKRTQENAGLDENGNPIFDNFEGINSAEAFMLLEDPEYSRNCGGVCIGYSDRHIERLLDDPRIQMIIGFHDKTNDPDKRYYGARFAMNYNGRNEAKKYVGKDKKGKDKYETVHVNFSSYLDRAEKLFKKTKDGNFVGEATFNGKNYVANDIPRLAADMYLAEYDVVDESGKQIRIPAYEWVKGHPNYYKLLADFALYNSAGEYCPMKKVAYNMPDTVPVLDANGNRTTMDTQAYIQAELQKELEMRDSLAAKMGDKDSGIIGEYIKRAKAMQKGAAISRKVVDADFSGGYSGKGYDGYSMSNNAREAYEAGEKPISKWTKGDILDSVKAINPDAAAAIKDVKVAILKKKLLTKTSWHHSSMYYNKTDFYSIDEDAVENISGDVVQEWLAEAERESKPTANSFRGDIEYIEWSGTRNHPKATNKKMSNVFIEEKGSFYLVYDKHGEVILRKKIGSNGTYVTNYEEVERRKNAELEKERIRKENSSEAANRLYDSMEGKEYSRSGHIYAFGRKPSHWDYEDGIENFFRAGEQRLAENDAGGYNVETWDGSKWVGEDAARTVSYKLAPETEASSREILANILMENVKPDERVNLERYRDRAAKLDSLEAELDEKTAQLRQLPDTKANADARYELQKQINSLRNRLKKWDSELLKVEATEPIQKLLARERKIAQEKKAAALKKIRDERSKDARIYEAKVKRLIRQLADTKAEAKKLKETLRELRDLQDRYDRAVASRDRKEMRRLEAEYREEIKKLRAEFVKAAKNPTDNVYVPAALYNSMIDVIDQIDINTDLVYESGKRAGQTNKAQERRNALAGSLALLKNEYEKMADTDNPLFFEYDEFISLQLNALTTIVGERKLADLHLSDLKAVYDVMRSIRDTLRTARQMVGWEDAKGVYEVADGIASAQASIAKDRKNGKLNAIEKAANWNDNNTLSPMRNVERMANYDKESSIVRLFRDFELGVRKQNKFKMESHKMFDPFVEKGRDKYEGAVYDVAGEYTDSRGRKFGVTKMQMMQALLSFEREQADDKLAHISKGGFGFADLDRLKNGDLSGAVDMANLHMVDPTQAEAMLEDFASIIESDPWCKKYMATARLFFNDKAKNAINEASMATKHRIVATGENYIPYEVDKTDVVKEVNAIADVQKTINGYGILQAMKNKAPQALIMTGLNNIIERHIDQVATVYGLSVPVKNFNKVWNTNTTYDGEVRKVRSIMEENWGKGSIKHIEQAVQDLQGSRPKNEGTLSGAYRWVRGNTIGATFLLNMSVVTKQIGSLFTAQSMIGLKNPITMFFNLTKTMANFKEISAEIDKYTATAWMRRQGVSDAEMTTLMTEGQRNWLGRYAAKAPAWRNPTKWIQAMDAAVAMSLWKYCKQEVAKNTDLKGEALMIAAAEFFDDVVEHTQSMGDVLHRPEVQKSGDPLSDVLGLFKTDLYQSAGQLRVLYGEMKANPTAENKKAVARTIVGIAMSSLWGQVMTAFFAAFRYKMGRYKDEEDEVTVASVAKRFAFGMFADLTSYVLPLFGGEMAGFIEAIHYKDSSALLDNVAFESINSLYTALLTLINKGDEADFDDWASLTVEALSMCGVPANNIYRFINAIIKHIKDIQEGKFLSFSQK